jgi:hypothetical protein
MCHITELKNKLNLGTLVVSSSCLLKSLPSFHPPYMALYFPLSRKKIVREKKGKENSTLLSFTEKKNCKRKENKIK